jgi:diguanylate cyclase (GGDEF)-like protein/PAS domain S-box-containing protein
MPRLPPPGSWSLKTKFALCSGALMFAFSVAFTTWTLHTVETDVHDSVVDAQRALVRSTADDIDAKVELRRDAMLTIAPLLAQAAPRPGVAMDTFFEPRPVLKKLFDAVLVVDADGRVVHALPARSAETSVGPGVADRAFFAQLRAGAPLVISSPFAAPDNSATYIAFAAPLRAPDGTMTGALIGLLNPVHGNFLGDLGKVRIGHEGFFILVERSENPRFVLHRQLDLINTLAPGGKDHPIMAGALQGREGYVEGPSTLGIESLRSFKPLHSVPWVLVAVYPTTEAFSGLRTRQREVLLVGSALFVLASAAAWLLSGWLLRPLSRLRRLMDHHAMDPGLAIAPKSFGSAELAALVQAYNAQAATRRLFEERLQASEQRVREVSDNVPASIAYIDRHERYTFANARMRSQFGAAGASLLGRDLRSVRGEAGYASIAPYVAAALLGEAVNFETSEMVDGERRFSESHYIPDRDESGQVRGFYKMTFDITALKLAQHRQASVEQRLRAITDHLPALIAHVDRDERYDFLNATFKTWLGIDPAAAVGRPMAEVIGRELYASRQARVARCLAGEASSFEMEAQTLVGRKVLRIDYLPDLASDGTVAGFYTFSSDITELTDVQQSLHRLVRSDSLTGLHNRVQFDETLPLALARCEPGGHGLALMFLDIDLFKQINDSQGHAVGDQILIEFALRLRRAVRSTDTVARLGGDEFVVILEGVDSAAAPQRVARSILAEIARPFALGQRQLTVTTSVGIALYGQAQDGESPSALLARADAALYQAKAAGRNTFQVDAG